MIRDRLLVHPCFTNQIIECSVEINGINATSSVRCVDAALTWVNSEAWSLEG